MDAPDENIRQHAYALWVTAGSPEGNGDAFWYLAEREMMEAGGLDQSNEMVAEPPTIPDGDDSPV